MVYWEFMEEMEQEVLALVMCEILFMGVLEYTAESEC